MIISNTTPLINFSSIERLDILSTLFGEIIIPPAVKNELIEKINIFPKLQTVLENPNIVVLNLKDDRISGLLNIDLHLGESESIALAIENHAKILLLDEMEGRRIAEYHKLKIIGTVGCLTLAKQKKIIHEVKPILTEIINKGNFWLSEKLYQNVLKTNNEDF
ncbi:MAG TPA: DUF3368 domain-containing protein [Leptospiraceae bacterium]|nr:DUF3368 domain-containing protein [Leptospiraceae bacterium]HMZ65672.1 DUF3368 domain-containing protein [Leptospiraceae bacterium]HNH01650.1 DUF3368 domain-containing protein [Leptospiraceae bacterium]HNI91650.1 DUF3368 domain-containing protein [Leptospiraceae bacterium]HNK59639.1 DUF3368 domain-containing protein [Leptospiraceae bacterium]